MGGRHHTEHHCSLPFSRPPCEQMTEIQGNKRHVCFYSEGKYKRHPKERIMPLFLCLEWGSTLSSCYCYLLSERFPDALFILLCGRGKGKKKREIIQKKGKYQSRPGPALARCLPPSLPPSLLHPCSQEAFLIPGESVRDLVHSDQLLNDG